MNEGMRYDRIERDGVQYQRDIYPDGSELWYSVGIPCPIPMEAHNVREYGRMVGVPRISKIVLEGEAKQDGGTLEELTARTNDGRTGSLITLANDSGGPEGIRFWECDVRAMRDLAEQDLLAD